MGYKIWQRPPDWGAPAYRQAGTEGLFYVLDYVIPVKTGIQELFYRFDSGFLLEFTPYFVTGQE
jgi:hypothetical protein